MRGRWIDASQGEEGVVAEVLSSWAQPTHRGGCGDSGRLTREEERALRQYTPSLKLFVPAGPAVQAALGEAHVLAEGAAAAAAAAERAAAEAAG